MSEQNILPHLLFISQVSDQFIWDIQPWCTSHLFKWNYTAWKMDSYRTLLLTCITKYVALWGRPRNLCNSYFLCGHNSAVYISKEIATHQEKCIITKDSNMKLLTPHGRWQKLAFRTNENLLTENAVFFKELPSKNKHVLTFANKGTNIQQRYS